MKPLQLLLVLVATITYSAATAQKTTGRNIPDDYDVPVYKSPREMETAPPSKNIEMPNLLPASEDKGNKKAKEELEEATPELRKEREQAWAEMRKKNAETREAMNKLIKTYTSMCNRNPNRELPSLVQLAGEIPEPELPALAKKIDFNSANNPYDRYIARIELWQKLVRDKTKEYGSITQKSPEQVKREAQQHADKMRNEVNNNPLIANMGGMEKVKNMTPAEREKAAKEALNKNPAMMMQGQADAGMQAFMEKMMSDPEFAKKYNGMSDNEKMAAYQKFVKEQTGEATLVKRDNKALEESMADRNKTNKFQEFEKLRELSFQRTLQLHELVNRQNESMIKKYDALAEKTNKTYGAIYEALPMQDFGEAGHMKNTGPFDKSKAVEEYRNGSDAAVANNYVFRNYILAMQYGIAVFDECIDTYWGNGKVPEIHGVDGVVVAGETIYQFLESCKQRAEEARRRTAINAGIQCAYEQILFGQCQK